MRTLFNDGWEFSELSLDESIMYKDGKPVLFSPEQFFEQAAMQKYIPVKLPHDWQIWHVNELYKNSVGFYRKNFTLTEEQIKNRHTALRFEAVYMNSAVWVNGKKAGEWKYGYSTFELDVSELVRAGQNEVIVIAVYQHCNTRWYSGAGIIRDVYFINTPETYLKTDGIYFNATPVDPQKLDGEWKVKLSCEVAGQDGMVEVVLRQAQEPRLGSQGAKIELLSPTWSTEFTISSPKLWDIDNPAFYKLTATLKDSNGTVLDELT